MALILENGGGDGVVARPTARAILDHIFVPAAGIFGGSRCRSVTRRCPVSDRTYSAGASSIVIGYLSHLPGGIVFYGNMTRSEEER